MKLNISQMDLFVAITKEVERQAKAQGIKKFGAECYQLNAIVEGANTVVAGFARETVPAIPAMGLINWLSSDDTGLSSKAMARCLFGTSCSDGDETFHPLDPSDFGRCHRFLLAVPEARPRIGEVARLSPQWARLIEAWDELTALYLEELPKQSAPRLYARMKELIGR